MRQHEAMIRPRVFEQFRDRRVWKHSRDLFCPLFDLTPLLGIDDCLPFPPQVPEIEMETLTVNDLLREQQG